MVIKVYDIGKVVKYNGVRLQVVKAVQGCRGCYFKPLKACNSEIVGACCKPWRCENVIFRKYDENKKENLHGRTKQNAGCRGRKIYRRAICPASIN